MDCFICLQEFDFSNKEYIIPCLNSQCNTNHPPVHARCIYEWNARLNNQGTCPMCRSGLGYIDYEPDDLIQSKHFDKYSFSKDFINKPVLMEAGMIRCYLKKYKDCIQFFVQAPTILNYPDGPLPTIYPAIGDRLVMTAKHKRFSTWITLDKRGLDFDKSGANYCGRVKSKLFGLSHSIIAPYRGFTSNPNLYNEIGIVKYEYNKFPRKFSIEIPSIEQNNTIKKTNKLKNNTDNYHFKNRDPEWDEIFCQYQLNFQGRANKSSYCNFQLEHDGDIYLQFGQIDVPDNTLELYTLDFKWPISPLQAFGISITSLYK